MLRSRFNDIKLIRVEDEDVGEDLQSFDKCCGVLVEVLLGDGVGNAMIWTKPVVEGFSYVGGQAIHPTE